VFVPGSLESSAISDSFFVVAMNLKPFQKRVKPQFTLGEKVQAPAIGLRLMEWSMKW
jgi:hypothetical protein